MSAIPSGFSGRFAVLGEYVTLKAKLELLWVTLYLLRSLIPWE